MVKQDEAKGSEAKRPRKAQVARVLGPPTVDLVQEGGRFGVVVVTSPRKQFVLGVEEARNLAARLHKLADGAESANQSMEG